MAKLDKNKDFNWLKPNSTQWVDINDLPTSQNYLAKMGDGSNRVYDVRYGFIPTEISPFGLFA